ncbi:hypothetical protein IQ249_06270 [Lusitaniella coriacea LEGE 07157]|uniref:SbsA Ig-like domain-containing protein n=1 Tax=Lusitaniella coriacea LEGE 07157 TaxID=945747 RepID=A0A8J7B415_9CYAN|nr:hypothetical protein [Lusitaniella coriacea]MBE9115502.1 hypothetical protein [Lusitaniella coriacea LEGE 07157]
MTSNPEADIQNSQRFYPFDRAAIAAIALLFVFVIGLTVFGKFLTPKVAGFSWQDRKIGADARAFVLKFKRPMDRASVEANLQIEPDLPGKIAWGDRELFYTLLQPPVYGEDYQVTLQGAKERYGEWGAGGRRIETFQGMFEARDRVFAYLGVEGDERGKLILYNLTQERKQILTPPDLIVIDFKPYPDSERILFSAIDSASIDRDLRDLQLYTVTTGLNSTQPFGRIQPILDARTYQNFQFDLSTDGKTVIIDRENPLNPSDTALWIVPGAGEPRSLGIRGETFAIAPDGQTLAVGQERGISLIPLTPQAPPLAFLPGYEEILEFSPDRAMPLLLDILPDGTRSLVLVKGRGLSPKRIPIAGLVRDCKFSPLQTDILYCFQLGGKNQPPEQPLLSLIDLKKVRETPFLALTDYQEVVISLSPDGLTLLFDQVVTTPSGFEGDPSQPETLAASIWLLRLPDPSREGDRAIAIQRPEKLFPGLNPVWLP